MTDDKIESLRRRVTERREAASRKLKETLGKGTPLSQPTQPPLPTAQTNRAALQSASAMLQPEPTAGLSDNFAMFGEDTNNRAERPPAPTGSWRCIVNSSIVSIDLVANIAEDGSLSGQGTIVYIATNRIYQVSGKGDWTLLPPDPSSEDWLFKFRLQPSNHAIFSWFASPTESPNHLYNRFVVPDHGGVVETNCERTG